ncbi:ribosomal-processing cysteine protease Prp [Atopobacter sp. AH10]|uniref:ribosomal-processing cysteine protease Prp n=1 Tax=Atopobacter sp. AH10 TaxID=2315861 RepID=UPI000EF2054A|nr:ribosomal-processing cysteine protease Prp [Atopobacter sp. AH10]RLK62974.1 ribosomal-processing cysteine protease Prp [Atopobacter sp. AH10]
MINCQWERSSTGWLAFSCQGHALFAPYGEDIVCAAVSSLCIATVNSLEALVGLDSQVTVQAVDEGLLKVRLPENLTEQQVHDSQLLLDHLYLALVQIADEYPKQLKIRQTPDGGATC